jgi:hypothetical protein
VTKLKQSRVNTYFHIAAAAEIQIGLEILASLTRAKVGSIGRADALTRGANLASSALYNGQHYVKFVWLQNEVEKAYSSPTNATVVTIRIEGDASGSTEVWGCSWTVLLTDTSVATLGIGTLFRRR